MLLTSETMTMTEPSDITRPGGDRAAKPIAAEASGAERRRGLRIRQHRPIKIFEPTTHRYFGGQTEDVSATGLRIELPLGTPVRAGRILNVHVGLNVRGEALANRRSMMPARVVWVERDFDADHARLTAGIEFISNISAHLDAA